LEVGGPDGARRSSPVLLIEVPHLGAGLRLAVGGLLEGVEELGEGDGFLAVGAGAAEADAGAGGVAVGAPLLAGVALFAVGAGVDGGLAALPGRRDGVATFFRTGLREFLLC